MRINEVCEQTGLTKKAINWYEQQGLIRVATDANGYRCFTKRDVERLEEIRLLRSLELSAKEIKAVLESADKPALLRELRRQKQRELERMERRCQYFDRLIQRYEPQEFHRLQQELEGGPVCRRLEQAFPGLFGKLLLAHFLPYLGEPIKTPEQAVAYENIVQFLDNVELKLPLTLRLLYRFCGKAYEGSYNPETGINRMLSAQGEELEAFKKTVRRQALLRQKWYVKHNPLARARRTLYKRLEAAGYYRVFLPNLRILSPAYADYCDRLQALNQVVCEQQGIRYDERYNVIIEEERP